MNYDRYADEPRREKKKKKKNKERQRKDCRLGEYAKGSLCLPLMWSVA